MYIICLNDYWHFRAVDRGSRTSWRLSSPETDPDHLQDNVTMENDKEWLRWVVSQFNEVAGEDAVIDPDEFKKALRVKQVRSGTLYP